MVVHEIHSAAQFASAHKDAKGKIVVVDFFATWCEPCKRIAPLYEQLSAKHEKLASFLKIDVDKVRDIAQAAGVSALPSFGIYHEGALLELQKGGDPVALEAKISALAAKHNTNAFKGAGYSMLGASSSAAAKPAGAGAGAPVKAIGANAPSAAAAGGARRNPWANPDFALAIKAKGEPAAGGAAAPAAAAKPAAAPVAAAPKAATPAAAPVAAKPAPVTAAPKPAAAPTPAAAPKPAAAPAAAVPKPAAAASAPVAAAKPASDSARVNPWATKEIAGATAPSAAAAAAPKPAAAQAPAPAAAAAAAPSSAAPAAVPVAAAAAPAADASAAPARADGSAASAPAAASSAAPPASSAPAANDPALTKNLNPGFLTALADMGFTRLRCEKALILTGNKSVDNALNWLMEHNEDADIDEPLQMVGSAGGKAGPNLDDMDEDERLIYEQMAAKKLSERGVAFAGGANVGPAAGSGKVSTLNMTTEEKMAWLANRRAEVKARKVR